MAIKRKLNWYVHTIYFQIKLPRWLYNNTTFHGNSFDENEANNWHISNSLLNGSIKCMPMECNANVAVVHRSVGWANQKLKCIICFLYWRLRHHPLNCHTPTVQHSTYTYTYYMHRIKHCIVTSDLWSVESVLLPPPRACSWPQWPPAAAVITRPQLSADSCELTSS